MTGLEQLTEAARLETARIYSHAAPEWHYPKPTTQPVENDTAAVERHLRLVAQEATA